MYEIGPTKFPLKNNDDKHSIWDGKNYLSIFGSGHDIYISSDFINNSSGTNFPFAYEDILGKGKSIFSSNMTNNNNRYSTFKLKEVEVFKLIK